jgi:hypothetical protein
MGVAATTMAAVMMKERAMAAAMAARAMAFGVVGFLQQQCDKQPAC